MSTNIAAAVIIWFFFPETGRRSLEDMEALFDPNYRLRIRLDEETELYQDDVDVDVDGSDSDSDDDDFPAAPFLPTLFVNEARGRTE